ncbi:poly-gamma-glutamate hydrolase family protein [Priestia megaterium]|uniref:poly-gamma-glutamate hydrolase family protein n=1 Tax=Priestia megaterium TaxID=1404 RepID=UPI00272EEECA|nr:poly-gamma-glutamate hydrolase family protein [Priestia megaterium]MDP1471840.1 poly-gamma-glutamate hydrolase family protein [Priestia megaterium]
MTDVYTNYNDLAIHETQGTDYQIRIQKELSPTVVLAIHGGGIEGGTSELATALAGNQDSYYLAEGLKPSGNEVLHITSTHFDEPQALHLVNQAKYVISFHGYQDSTNKHTKIGGKDLELRKKIYKALITNGFSAEIIQEPSKLKGFESNNITNRTKTGKGVQLEISTAQHNAFFEKNTQTDRIKTQNKEFWRYVKAVKSTLPK